MLSVIEKLLKGDDDIAKQFSKARDFWLEFAALHQDDTIEQIAEALGHAQFKYEALFDHDRWLAKSTMPYTCLGSLYDEAVGWDYNGDFAVRLANAFELSTVSLEIKSFIVEAVALYGLYDRDKALREAVQKRYGKV